MVAQYTYGSYTFSWKKSNESTKTTDSAQFEAIHTKFSKNYCHNIAKLHIQQTLKSYMTTWLTWLCTHCFVLDYFKVWDRRLLNSSGYLVINTLAYGLSSNQMIVVIKASCILVRHIGNLTWFCLVPRCYHKHCRQIKEFYHFLIIYRSCTACSWEHGLKNYFHVLVLLLYPFNECPDCPLAIILGICNCGKFSHFFSNSIVERREFPFSKVTAFSSWILVKNNHFLKLSAEEKRSSIQ